MNITFADLGVHLYPYLPREYIFLIQSNQPNISGVMVLVPYVGMGFVGHFFLTQCSCCRITVNTVHIRTDTALVLQYHGLLG
jgi:hypothetical protein